MKSITTTVQSFLEHEEIRFEHTEIDGVCKSGLIGENGCCQGYVAADEDKRTVQIQTLAPLTVSRGKRLEVAGLLTRINQHVMLGTLKLNMGGGAAACRKSVTLGESGLHHNIMGHLLYANWDAMDGFFPTINAILFGDMSPKRAIDGMRRRQPQPDDPDDRNPHESFRRRLGDIMRGSMN